MRISKYLLLYALLMGISLCGNSSDSTSETVTNAHEVVGSEVCLDAGVATVGPNIGPDISNTTEMSRSSRNIGSERQSAQGACDFAGHERDGQPIAQHY